MKIAIAINILTGNTSKKPIIVDLVSVVAKPTKKAIAIPHPTIVVILFICPYSFFLTSLTDLQ